MFSWRDSPGARWYENRRYAIIVCGGEAMESQLKHKGHLKIFFGYAAGVGKTYGMLEAARAAKSEGN